MNEERKQGLTQGTLRLCQGNGRFPPYSMPMSARHAVICLISR